MYTRKTYRFGRSNEYVYTWFGQYGKKGERGKKRKATQEQVRKQNQFNRENKVRRKIKLNFEEDDPWATLKYQKGTRKPAEEFKKDVDKFIRSMRGKYRRKGSDFKYIIRMEVGARGGLHAHILFNKHPDGKHMEEAKKTWQTITGGHIHMEPICMDEVDKLANYIVKEPNDEIEEQLSLFPKEDRKAFLRYSCSRNLEEPVPEKKDYRRRTVEKLVKEGPVATPGYYIVKESIRCGINPYTGRSYLYYTENKIRGR